MLSIKRLIKDKNGRMFMSILWGLGLAAMFAKVCNSRNCLVYSAGNPNFVEKQTYNHNGKCYKYKTYTTDCQKDAVEHIF